MMHGVDVSDFYVSDDHPMYVQRWNPAGPATHHRPVVLVHGGAHMGLFWTTCPDGRPGWAPYLAANGRTVYVVDWPGTGRSPRPDDFLTAGPAPCVEALRDLLRLVGPADMMGHSIGAALCVKVIDLVPECVSAFIALEPAPPGIRESEVPSAPLDAPVRFDETGMRAFFTNADRFPRDHIAEYRRSLCDLSPSIFNVVARAGSDHALHVGDPTALRSTPSIVIAGDQDALVSEDMARCVADFLDAELVMVGRHWGLDGFGHMIPIEIGFEAVADRLLDWLESSRR